MRTLSTQAQDIFRLQDKLNSTIEHNWKEVKHPYLRAAWVECAELLNYLDWEWWKHNKIDVEQAVLEVIDVLHFVVSQLIVEGYTSQYFVKAVRDIHTIQIDSIDLTSEDDKETVLKMVEKIAYYSVNKQATFALSSILMTFRYLNTNMDEVHIIYLGKSCLNEFRQLHGYKEGTYTKIWGDYEDNHYLDIAISQTKSRSDFNELDSEDIQDCIWGLLDKFYYEYS